MLYFLENGTPTITDQLRRLISSRTIQVLIISLISMLMAQVIKFILISLKTRHLEWHLLISTGGFPSSHTSFCIALDASLLILQLNIDGQLDWSFTVAVVFSIIIIHDAMGVRLEASKHARILNKIADNLTEEEKLELGYGKKGHLKEMLGHRFREVLGGLIVGLFVGVLGSFMVIWWS